MIHHRVFYFISESTFVLNRHKDTSLSTIEFICSYQETMSNCQSILCEIVYFRTFFKNVDFPILIVQSYRV